MFRKADAFFTTRRKFFAAIAAVVFALLWLFLWNAFPMQFYSLFFYRTSLIGSNIQLILLNTVVLLPMLFIFTLITGFELSFCKTVLMNIFLIAAVEYVFSIFMFSDMFYICIIAYIIHAAANIWVFGSAEAKPKKVMKGMRSPEAGSVPAVKYRPVISVVWAAAFAFVSDAACIALMYIMARIYAY